MDNNKNPLIADTAKETVENVSEALEQLAILIAPGNSGLARLMEPLLHALEQAAKMPELNED